MADELELLDSKNEPIEELSDEDDLDVIKEKYRKLSEKHKDVFGKNRQLFERTKKAETDFKEFKAQAEDSKKSKKDDKSDEQLLKRLDSMALKVAGITVDDEVEFFEKWRQDNGYENADIETVLNKKGFQTEFADFRTTKANAAATSDVKGESGTSGEKNTPDYWLAKATKNAEGELMFPDDMPKDFNLRAAIIEKMGASTKGNKEFYNQ